MTVMRFCALACLFAACAEAQQAPATPLSLASATDSALRQVSAFQQAQIDEQLAAEDLKQARASLLPRVRDSYTITYNSPAHPLVDPGAPSFIGANAIHEYQNLVGIAGDVNLGMIAAIRRSRALLIAARAGTEIARRQFIRGVSEAYYGVALATAKRQAAEISYDAAREFERVTRLNYEAGEVPEVDAIRAHLQTAARRDELAQAQQAEAIANASLGTLLGAAIGVAPSIEPLPQTVAAGELSSLTAAGVAKRPEFTQLAAQLQAAHFDVGAARADFLPRITYSVDRGFDTSSLASEQIREHRGLLATASIDVPLFDWGLTRSRLRQAQLRAKSAEVQRQLTTRDLYLQFETARQEALTAQARVDNARQALLDAERNAAISVARYRAGEAAILEATDAQTTLAQQRLALQQALFDYVVARGQLREAAGE
jgi:outer membrane protein TolC